MGQTWKGLMGLPELLSFLSGKEYRQRDQPGPSWVTSSPMGRGTATSPGKPQKETMASLEGIRSKLGLPKQGQPSLLESIWSSRIPLPWPCLPPSVLFSSNLLVSSQTSGEGWDVTQQESQTWVTCQEHKASMKFKYEGLPQKLPNKPITKRKSFQGYSRQGICPAYSWLYLILGDPMIPEQHQD